MLPPVSDAVAVRVTVPFVQPEGDAASDTVGTVASVFRTYVLEFVVPPVSEMRRITLVDAFAGGVKVYERALALSVHVDPPFTEYATAVCGDGPPVSVMVQVVAGFVFCHVPLT